MEETKKSVFVEFGEDTTIHGLREIVTKKYDVKVNILWLILFIAAIALVTSTIKYTAEEYMSNPTATELSLGSADSFPDMIFCPEIWINDVAARNIGYTKDMNTFVQTLMVQSPTRFFWTANPKAKTKYGDTDWKAVRKSLEQLLVANNVSLGHLLTRVMYNPQSMAKFIPTSLEINFTFSARLNTVGMCFRFQDHRTFNNFTAGRALLVFQVRRKSSNITFVTQIPRSMSNLFFIGPTAGSAIPDDAHVVSSLKSYEIRISYLLISKYYSKEVCNRYTDWGAWDLCIQQCINNACVEEGLCQVYFPGATATDRDLSKYCTYLNISNHCLNSGASYVDKCQSQCLKPCSYRKVSLSVMPLDAPGLPEGISQMVFSLDSPTLVLAMTEYASFSTVTLFCNIGGLVSLFMGCSIMSLLHAFCFCALKGYSRAKQK